MEMTTEMHQVFLLMAGLAIVRDDHMSAFRCTGSCSQEPCPLGNLFFFLSPYCLILLTAVFALL